jgi:glycosyltransferase involved in cell wall biosynthesis
MVGGTGVGILTFVPDRWESYWQSRHHIMSRLAAHYKVLWVSPPTNWRDVPAENPRSFFKTGLKKASSSLWIYSPEYFLPVIYRPKWGANTLERLRVKRIKSFIAAMGIKRLVVYIWRPEFASYSKEFNRDLLCYHIDDEYTFSDADLPTSSNETNLIKNADVVFISSKTLIRKKGNLGSDVYYMPNGVDFSHYRNIVSNENTYLPEFDNIPSPRIGYSGYIKEDLDLKLLLHIARKRKDWSLVLVGPVQETHLAIREDIDLLRRENNVYFLGGKRPEDLPGYIKKMDVCLMCYRKNMYTHYIYPMKLHEYLACGKPIVAAELENLKEFSNVLYFADDSEEWIDKIQIALGSRGPEMEIKRIEVASQNSWDQRVNTIRSIIEKKLQRDS